MNQNDYGKDLDPDGKLTSHRTIENQIKEIIGKLSREALAEFVRDLINRDNQLQHLFIARFAEFLEEDDVGDTWQSLVRDLYHSAKNRHGYINYHESQDLSTKLCELLERADELHIDKPEEGVRICKAVLEIVPGMLPEMDISGEAEFIFSQAFASLERIALNASDLVKSELYSYCMEEYFKGQYREFALETFFLELLPLVVTTGEQEKEFLALVDQLIEEKQPRASKQQIYQLIQLKVNYWLIHDADKAFELMEANMDYPDFKEMLVNRAISTGDFETGRQLCLQALEEISDLFDFGNPRSRWLVKLFDIGKAEENIQEARHWAEELFDDFPDMDGYLQLKEFVPEDEWPDRREKLINDLLKKNRNSMDRHSSLLAEIYTVEKDDDSLLKWLQVHSDDIDFVDAYSTPLKKSCPEELIELYRCGIRRYAVHTGREFYTRLAMYLHTMKEIQGGENAVFELIKEFHVQYRNRPAMQEILRDHFPEEN